MMDGVEDTSIDLDFRLPQAGVKEVEETAKGRAQVEETAGTWAHIEKKAQRGAVAASREIGGLNKL